MGFASNENCYLTKPLEGPTRDAWVQGQPQTHAAKPIWALCPRDGRRLPGGSLQPVLVQPILPGWDCTERAQSCSPRNVHWVSLLYHLPAPFFPLLVQAGGPLPKGAIPQPQTFMQVPSGTPFCTQYQGTNFLSLTNLNYRMYVLGHFVFIVEIRDSNGKRDRTFTCRRLMSLLPSSSAQLLHDGTYFKNTNAVVASCY